MFSNWQYRLLALVLALACWYIVTGREKVEAWVDVPVEIVNAPEDLAIQGDGLPTSIKARIRGSRALIRSLTEKPKAYSLDLSELAPGENSLILEKKNLTIPMALEVVDIDPQRLTVAADRLVSRSLPVKPVFRGGPGEDFELAAERSDPMRITVRGPETVVGKLDEVPTLSRDVNATGPGEVVYEVGLALPERVTSDVAGVRVALRYAARTKAVWIRLPVKVLPENVEGRSVSLKPTTVQIQADVPLTLLRREDFKSLFLVTAMAPASFKEGRHLVPVNLRLPEGCALRKTVPEMVEVRVKKG
ncbi:CdaR family protein [Desulfocurvus sp. DL9XJH121]